MRDAKCKEQYKFMKSVHFNDDGMIMCYTSGIANSVVQHIFCKWSTYFKSNMPSGRILELLCIFKMMK
jgi:hypothetical protein